MTSSIDEARSQKRRASFYVMTLVKRQGHWELFSGRSRREEEEGFEKGLVRV